MRRNSLLLSCCIVLTLVPGCDDADRQPKSDQGSASSTAQLSAQIPYYAEWPVINSAIPTDPVIEKRIVEILAQMTLEEKVGQMIQPNLHEVTPEEAGEYKLGSLLNGGGVWPGGNKYATAADWAATADAYYMAVEDAFADRGFRIPFMWATDAVHGHNNVFRATVFPHNIGLGAANNPELIKQIGQITAREVVATGLDWTFAPTVASPRDLRWGRVYEGYSEDPEIIYRYAGKMVEGLQGGAAGLKGEANVISNVKHWVGDGGTTNGVDRGVNRYDENYLRNIHAFGYFSGLNAGAQIVMTSFNSWQNEANYDLAGTNEYNGKIHGSKYLLTDVLKDKMGFDGLVVTDWNGHEEINGCSASDCPQAVNAGNDVIMVTARQDWKAFYQNVIDQVKAGIIPKERIDDAVTRILRVKMRANLWEKPRPSQRQYAGQNDLLGAPEHRALAREAVSQSLVLLKNQDNVLPLSAQNQAYLIVGNAANDIQKQTGGWTLTWQGTENEIGRDFPGATTLLMALTQQVGDDNVYTDIEAAPKGSIAIVVTGEDPYSEMFGDIKDHQTLEYASLKPAYGKDLATIKALKAAGFKVVTIFYSGRPLYVNEEINHSDAFVAAWLPGTEAGGITDVLFSRDDKDFTGRLSYSWPKKKCSTRINRPAPHIPNYQTPEMEQDISGEHKPLFAYGYGLSYSQSPPAIDEDLNNLPLDPRNYGCEQSEADTGIASISLEVFGRKSAGEFIAYISGDATGWSPLAVSGGEQTSFTADGATEPVLLTRPINYKHQQDALHVKFSGHSAAQLYMQTPDGQTVDKNSYLNAKATLQFDIDMKSPAPESLVLSVHCQWPCRGELKIHKVLPPPTPAGETNWTTIKVPLHCFADQGMQFNALNTPFLLYAAEAVEFNLGEIRYVPSSLDPAEDAVSCDEVR